MTTRIKLIDVQIYQNIEEQIVIKRVYDDGKEIREIIRATSDLSDLQRDQLESLLRELVGYGEAIGLNRRNYELSKILKLEA